jgi:hypothetical protein
MVPSGWESLRRPVARRCVLFSTTLFIAWGVGLAADPLPPGHMRRSVNGAAFQLHQFQVDRGNDTTAKEYYREKVSPQLQFRTRDTIVDSSITDLLKYFGYENIAPRDLHQLPSDRLMRLSAEGDILATRFFAPKITHVSATPVQIPASGFGWRKLVRLKAKVGSMAANNGMEMLLFLQNIFEKTIAGDPFNVDKNVSIFNQAIVVRKEGPFSDERHSIYFLTYGPLVKVNKEKNNEPIKDQNGNFQDEGKLTTSLNATFDEDAREPETNARPKEYFVPDSCIQCHGRSRPRGKVNYLDTDHWFDRVTPDYGVNEQKYKEEDFTALAESPCGMLYDGGKDAADDKFQKAFGVIRQLNDEIANQNSRLGEAGNFQLGAVRRWLDMHKPDGLGTSHVPPYERGFGDERWDPSNETHRKLLYSLNRYCYRCHSSVKYNVFDLKAVKARIDSISDPIPERVVNITDPTVWMPQDRIFPGLAVNPMTGQPEATGDLKEFLDLLSHLRQP